MKGDNLKMQNKSKIDTNVSIYQNWINNNGKLVDIPGIEYFGNQFTFAEIDKMIDVYARAFKSLRNKKDSSVTICGLTLPSTLFAFYALNKMGIRVNIVSSAVLKSNGKEYIDNNETETLILLDRFYPSVAEELSKTNLKNVIVAALGNDTSEQVKQMLGGTNFVQKVKDLPSKIDFISLDDFVAEGQKRDDKITAVNPKGDTAVVLYTGGSTGIPKGVEITNEGVATMYNMNLAQGYDYEIGDRNLCLIPPNHPSSFVNNLVTPWLWGVTNVLQPLYDKNRFAKDLKDLRIQYASAAPSHYQALLQSDLQDGDLSHVKWLLCGGEFMSYETALDLNRLFERTGVQNPYIGLAWGMSEIGPLAIYSIPREGLYNKVGQPLPQVEARIVDENGNVLGDNERGLLEIKTPARMKCYYKNPELTNEFFTADGYAKTLDIAVRDKNGNYSILGRANDSYLAPNGNRIYMFDIENYLYQDFAIVEAEVIKLPVADGINQFVPLVHLVLKTEWIGLEAEVLARINQKCNQVFVGYSAPKGYKIRDSFGTNPISAKRDYLSLATERDGYYRLTDDNQIVEVSFPEIGKEVTRLINSDQIVIHKQETGPIKELKR